MMDAIKGVARRTAQALRERLYSADVTPPDPAVLEVSRKVYAMEARSITICEKVIRAARLMEDLGVTLREIGEQYRQVPDLAPESMQLAEDVLGVGVKLVETSQEHQKGLKDNGFDLLHHFSKECARLKELEQAAAHHRLEYDFFRAKVTELRQSPQKDFTRIPRNEQILENWRVELWRVTESLKARLSSLYMDGRRAIDVSVLTTVQVLNSFVDIASTGFKQTFYNARLPSYPQEPVLPPAPLPPNPMPPYMPASSAVGDPTRGYHSHTAPSLASPPQGYAYASPPQQPQAQWAGGQTSAAWSPAGSGMQAPPQHQQQQQQQVWNGGPPSAPVAQPPAAQTTMFQPPPPSPHYQPPPPPSQPQVYQPPA